MSHQQIDDFLVEKESGKYPDLKGQLLGKVKDFIEVSKILTDAGISFIPLKGPILSYRLYDDPSYRYFSDLDLLMDIPNLKRAIESLKESGYKAFLYEWPSKFKKESLMLRRDNQFLVYHPDKNICIELHWKPFHYNLMESKPFNELIRNNLADLKYGNLQFKVFNKELEILYLVIHGGLHAWSWLKWLIDVNKFLIKYPPDPELFKKLTLSLNAHRLVALCNSMLAEYFPDSPLLPDSSITPKFLNNFASKAILKQNGEPSSVLERIKLSLFRLRCFKGNNFKYSVIRYLLYSSGQLHGNSIKTSLPIDNIRRIVK